MRHRFLNLFPTHTLYYHGADIFALPYHQNCDLVGREDGSQSKGRGFDPITVILDGCGVKATQV